MPIFGKSNFAKGIGHLALPVMGVGMIAMPAFLTQGGAYEKTKATVTGAFDLTGFEIAQRGISTLRAAKAARTGMALSKIATGTMGIAGGLAGGFVLSTMAEGAFDFQEHLAKLGGANRQSSAQWGNTSSLFSEKAYTMRQQSLMAMNRGSMSARSLLGREASIMHK